MAQDCPSVAILAQAISAHATDRPCARCPRWRPRARDESMALRDVPLGASRSVRTAPTGYVPLRPLGPRKNITSRWRSASAVRRDEARRRRSRSAAQPSVKPHRRRSASRQPSVPQHSRRSRSAAVGPSAQPSVSIAAVGQQRSMAAVGQPRSRQPISADGQCQHRPRSAFGERQRSSSSGSAAAGSAAQCPRRRRRHKRRHRRSRSAAHSRRGSSRRRSSSRQLAAARCDQPITCIRLTSAPQLEAAIGQRPSHTPSDQRGDQRRPPAASDADSTPLDNQQHPVRQRGDPFDDHQHLADLDQPMDKCLYGTQRPGRAARRRRSVSRQPSAAATRMPEGGGDASRVENRRTIRCQLTRRCQTRSHKKMPHEKMPADKNSS